VDLFFLLVVFSEVCSESKGEGVLHRTGPFCTVRNMSSEIVMCAFGKYLSLSINEKGDSRGSIVSFNCTGDVVDEGAECVFVRFVQSVLRDDAAYQSFCLIFWCSDSDHL